MRPQRLYDPKQTFYALTAFKYAGVDYKRGDKFDIGEMPNRKRIQFFQNWYIGYTEDFRDNKASIKEVEVESEQKPVAESTEEPKAEEKPKQTSSRRGRRKKTTATSSDS